MQVYKFLFGPLQTNTFFVVCLETKKGVIIDPALHSAETLLECAKREGFSIEKILLTHSHWDHFADAFVLKQKTGAPLFVHSLDAKNLENPGSDQIPLFVPIHPVSADQFLKDGDLISVGNLQFFVIHTPGHSPGSVCFYLKEHHVLISGDTLFQGSIGNLSLPTANAEHMWQSLKKLALLPEQTRVLPGHGEDTTIAQENWLVRAEQIFARS